MESILFPVLSLGGTGLAMGLFLAYASKKFEVEVDEKIEKIMEILPGVNCGACGYPGCAGYAEAIALNGAEMTACSPGGAETAQNIANIMGVSVNVSGEKFVAKLLCQGDCTKTTKKYDFSGSIKTCKAVNLYAGGDKLCSYGCLGYGDCSKVCPTNAILLTETGIIAIDENKCISCKKCVGECPKNLIEMLPINKNVQVNCKSQDKGAIAKKSCSVACIGCSLCQKSCPKDAIEIQNSLAKIDPVKCVNCEICVSKCPTKAITSNKVKKTAKPKVEAEQVG